MYVLAFDRDWTVDVNPHPRHDAVPLEWVQYWAHDTPHEVWAIGNQDLVTEAEIPGTVESIRRRDGDIDALGEQDEDGYYEWWPTREERLHILAELFPDATEYIAVDTVTSAYPHLKVGVKRTIAYISTDDATAGFLTALSAVLIPQRHIVCNTDEDHTARDL